MGRATIYAHIGGTYMYDENIRNAIAEYAKENDIEDGIKLLSDHSYDHSIIGITESGTAIYDYNKMVEELMKDEGWDETEAIEWIDAKLAFFEEDGEDEE